MWDDAIRSAGALLTLNGWILTGALMAVIGSAALLWSAFALVGADRARRSFVAWYGLAAYGLVAVTGLVMAAATAYALSGR